jgi:hypothetical protein
MVPIGVRGLAASPAVNRRTPAVRDVEEMTAIKRWPKIAMKACRPIRLRHSALREIA